MKNRFYTYIYLDPRKPGRYCYKDVCFLYEPFYIGKGQGKRCLNHLKKINKHENGHFKNKLLKILKSEFTNFDMQNYVLIIRDSLLEQEAFDFEKKLINEIGRFDLRTGPLVNLTAGGDGVLDCVRTKRNFEDIREAFEKRGYTLLTQSNKYENRYTKLHYLCQKGHNRSITWNDFREGYGCAICAGQIIDFATIKDVFEKRGYTLLTNKYKNTHHQKLDYMCPKGHHGTITRSDFRQGRGCPICGTESRSIKQRGEKNHNHKLTCQDIESIKLLLNEGQLIQKEIANKFNVDQATISRINTKKRI